MKWTAILVVTFTAAACVRTPVPSGPVGPIDPADNLGDVTSATRRGYIRVAQVWRPIDTATLDLMAGPRHERTFAVDARINCDYVDDGPPLTGGTPKFLCRDAEGVVHKVKYGDKNGEVFAEAAASRLFWALGFGSDTIYPVQVVCRGCPMDPWLWKTRARFEEREYRLATVERKFEADAIETKASSGWSWPELDLVDSHAGGAPLAHRDALKLLAVFVQHGDNGPQQQRLVCLPGGVSRRPGGERCERPFLLVGDLGATFGGPGALLGSSQAKLDFAHWSANRVWKGETGCVGNLDADRGGTMQNPEVREAGRQFLAERLSLLSDAQIRDMFVAARVDARDQVIEEGGRKRRVTADDWVQAFKQKRQEIAGRRCPE
jgi:hypothetical protein